MNLDALLSPNREIPAKLDQALRSINNGQFQASIDILDPLIAENPALVRPRMMRAQAYENLGQIPHAIEQYEDLLKSDLPPPFNCLVRNNLAVLLTTVSDKSLRDGERAVHLAEHALKLSGDSQPDIYDTLAGAYAETGDFERAIETQQKAIELRPDNKTYRSNLELYQSNRTLAEALPGVEE